MHRIIAVAALVAWPAVARAQEGAVQNRPRISVKYDLATRTFEPAVPFSEAFQLTGDLPENVDSIQLRYSRTELTESGARRANPPTVLRFKRSSIIQQKQFSFNVGALRPNKPYLFRFVLYSKREARADTTGTTREAAADTTRRTARKSAADTTRYETVSDSMAVVVTARASLANHFDSDAGVMHSFNADYWGIVTDSHFYLLPINKNEDVSALPALERLAKRLSIFAGLAVQELHSDDDVKELFGVGSPVLGVGLRGIAGIEQLRVNGGVIFFKQDDANPLVTTEHTKRDGFVSLTVDLEIQKLLTPLIAFLK